MVSAIIGMAGGMVLLAVMLTAGLDPKVAVPVHAVVQLVSNGTRVIAQLKYVRWRPFLAMALAALPGPWLGMWLLQQLDADTVRLFTGMLVLYATWVPKWGIPDIGQTAAFLIAGALVGVLGVVVGAVGSILAPFFLRTGFEKEPLIATKAVCQAYSHILKIVAFGAAGFSFVEQARWIAPMAIATVAGTFLGTWLLQRISDRAFYWIYRAVLTVLGLKLVFSHVL